MTPREALKRYFGYDSFRPGQEEIVSALLAGRDALAIMPTGAGKSLCYQVPALLLPGLTLVISPLISLMQDQVKGLNAAGIHAAFINSSLTETQIARALDLAAAITKGDITLHNVIPKHMEPITAKLRAAGCEVEEFDDALRITRTGELKPLKLKTMPHPGFPTDMQPLMTALLTLAKGTSIVTEGIWENRFRYVDELIHMGANIQVDGQVAVIEGVKELHPAPLRATDLRAGAAMVMAALAANGVSEVDETIHIERGYENIVEKLQALGADIRRVEIPANAVSRAI